MYKTRTGNFAIGFRRGWSDWQKDLSSVIAWSKENGLSVIDLGRDVADMKAVAAAGLKMGSVDLQEWQNLISAEAGVRKAAIETTAAAIEAGTAAGARNFFAVLLPADAALPRAQNFGYAVESLGALVPVLEKCGGRVVIEGYPGAGALACTPEGYRALFKELPSPAIGINYDPSHLLRMGIDPLRFINEFAPRVGHVHGKDTEILPDRLYEFGTEQPATFARSMGFGATFWRYTIPGQGSTNWGEVLRTLQSAGYNGYVSIELEDENFNGTEAGEKQGILAGAQFLAAA